MPSFSVSLLKLEGGVYLGNCQKCFSKSHSDSGSLSIQRTAMLPAPGRPALSVLSCKKEPSCSLVPEIRLLSTTINNLDEVSATTMEFIKFTRRRPEWLPFKRFLLRMEVGYMIFLSRNPFDLQGNLFFGTGLNLMQTRPFEGGKEELLWEQPVGRGEAGGAPGVDFGDT